MNNMSKKTPEERRQIALKSHATRRKNKEAREKKRADAEDRVLYLKNEIEALEKKRDSIAEAVFIGEISTQLTGLTLLHESQIVAAAKSLDIFCGVYFLVKNSRVVYVGQSLNVFSRIAQHAALKRDFDSIAWVPCDQDNLDKLESLYIQVLQPEMNGNGGSNGTKTAPIKIDELLCLGS